MTDGRSSNLSKQFERWVTLRIPASPSPVPYLKCFVLPHCKACRIHYGWLDNLLPRENTLHDRIHIGFLNIRYPASLILVNSHVCQVRELLAFHECTQLCLRAQELQICLLVHITTRRTPSCSKSSVVGICLL